MKKKQTMGWTKEQAKKVEKYLKSDKGKKDIQKIMDSSLIPHCHTFPSREPCCIEWWQSIKDKPFNI